MLNILYNTNQYWGLSKSGIRFFTKLAACVCSGVDTRRTTKSWRGRRRGGRELLIRWQILIYIYICILYSIKLWTYTHNHIGLLHDIFIVLPPQDDSHWFSRNHGLISREASSRSPWRRSKMFDPKMRLLSAGWHSRLRNIWWFESVIMGFWSQWSLWDYYWNPKLWH
jgi:hypothetical protein